MNKGQRFWHQMWQEGNIPFHNNKVDADLIRFWPLLNASLPVTVLTPLCGKSLDMIWLKQQGAQVTGIELNEQAIEQFARDNVLPMTKSVVEGVSCYSSGSITVWVHDIFTLAPQFIEPVDIIYDKASLIALPQSLRARYVAICMQWLKRQGWLLVKTMEYDQTVMDGPPYSVSRDEIYALYGEEKTVQLLSKTPKTLDSSTPLYARGLRRVWDYVWLIRPY